MKGTLILFAGFSNLHNRDISYSATQPCLSCNNVWNIALSRLCCKELKDLMAVAKPTCCFDLSFFVKYPSKLFAMSLCLKKDCDVLKYCLVIFPHFSLWERQYVSNHYDRCTTNYLEKNPRSADLMQSPSLADRYRSLFPLLGKQPFRICRSRYHIRYFKIHWNENKTHRKSFPGKNFKEASRYCQRDLNDANQNPHKQSCIKRCPATTWT